MPVSATWCPPPTPSPNWFPPGGRVWKIENEAVNTLKNQGYHLKHNFGLVGPGTCSEAFFMLNLLPFFMEQIFELVDGLYQRVRTFGQFMPTRSGTRCAPPSGCYCLTSGMPRTRHAPARGRPSTQPPRCARDSFRRPRAPRDHAGCPVTATRAAVLGPTGGMQLPDRDRKSWARSPSAVPVARAERA